MRDAKVEVKNQRMKRRNTVTQHNIINRPVSEPSLPFQEHTPSPGSEVAAIHHESTGACMPLPLKHTKESPTKCLIKCESSSTKPYATYTPSSSATAGYVKEYELSKSLTSAKSTRCEPVSSDTAGPLSPLSLLESCHERSVSEGLRARRPSTSIHPSSILKSVKDQDSNELPLDSTTFHTEVNVIVQQEHSDSTESFGPPPSEVDQHSQIGCPSPHTPAGSSFIPRDPEEIVLFPPPQTPRPRRAPRSPRYSVEESRYQRWKLLAFMFLTRVQLKVLAHWILTCIVQIFLIAGILLDKWRFLYVNREALLIMWEQGKISQELVTTPVAYTRSQGIFSVCFVQPEFTVANLTDPFVKTGCHGILRGIKVRMSQFENHRFITNLMVTQHVLGPVACILSAITILIQLIAAYRRTRSRLPNFINCGIRTANTIICLVLLVCGLKIDAVYRTDDPAYPVLWPKLIRIFTDLRTWDLGVIDLISAMVCQLLCIGLDVYLVRRAILAPSDSSPVLRRRQQFYLHLFS